jgi:hypothetical protein
VEVVVDTVNLPVEAPAAMVIEEVTVTPAAAVEK